ncbi:glycosyltransferase family 2 protein [Jejudonia soesokkakensis]|uniref:Glycosyltransferase family 2 protein n=1 Tax=Jejudonia soesokkakensis TaxID=1323432 RepID=A0ABW2MT28_9FLAO
MISVITINFNNKLGLERTLKSVISQRDLDFEYIVIDGNSTDGSKDLLELNKNAISILVSEPDSGIYNAMNKGIRLASGDYLLFLNSGDVLFNDTVLNRVFNSLNNDIDIFYGDLILINNFNDIEDIYPNNISFAFLFEKSLPHPATFIKKELFYKYHYYSENLNIVADWEFFMLAIIKYNVSIKHLGFFITKFDTTGISNQSKYREAIIKERDYVMMQHFPLLIELLKDFNLFNSNRFKLLRILEGSKLAQKLNSLWLRLLLFFLKGKRLKDL